VVSCPQSLKSDFIVNIKERLLEEYSNLKVKFSDQLNLASIGHCTTTFPSYIIVSCIFETEEEGYSKEVYLQVSSFTCSRNREVAKTPNKGSAERMILSPKQSHNTLQYWISQLLLPQDLYVMITN